MCVQFATNQPAPKGNLVVHCGGKKIILPFLLIKIGFVDRLCPFP